MAIFGAFLRRSGRLKTGPGLQPGMDVGPVVNQRALDDAMAQIDDAVKKGGRVLAGGGRVASLPGNDLAGTLKAIRMIGYRTVEAFVAEYKLKAKELRTAITDADLTAPSAHFGYEDFGTRFECVNELGVECVVCSILPPVLAVSADGCKRGVESVQRVGRAGEVDGTAIRLP